MASDTLFAATVVIRIPKRHPGRVSILGGSDADYLSVRDAVELAEFPAANEEDGRWLNTVDQAYFDAYEEALVVESEDAAPLVRTARPITGNQLPQGVGVPENGCSVSLQTQLSVADEPLATQPTNALFSVWPYSEEDVFTASITLVDGKVKISYSPELDDDRKTLRRYTTWGKKSLLEATWMEVSDGDESDYNFFKVSVEKRSANEL